jgi:hypothetical protein
MTTAPTQNEPQHPSARPAPPGPVPPKKKSHKLRWTLLALLGGIVGIIIAVSAGGGGTATTATPNAPTTNQSPGASKGIGSQDASGDVKLGSYTTDAIKVGHVGVTVTNHSSKRSDYMITVALESADGHTQYDTADVYVQNLEPGQTSSQDGIFTNTSTNPPANTKLVLKSVERTASF